MEALDHVGTVSPTATRATEKSGNRRLQALYGGRYTTGGYEHPLACGRLRIGSPTQKLHRFTPRFDPVLPDKQPLNGPYSRVITGIRSETCASVRRIYRTRTCCAVRGSTACSGVAARQRRCTPCGRTHRDRRSLVILHNRLPSFGFRLWPLGRGIERRRAERDIVDFQILRAQTPMSRVWFARRRSVS